MEPTKEQAEAVELFGKGRRLAIEAGAGTGKTTTLKLLGQSTQKRGAYMAFNRSIVEEAKRKFPANVSASTAHSLAFRAVGRDYRKRLDGQRMRNDEVARILGVDPIKVTLGQAAKMLQPGFLAARVMGAATRFCQSADPEPGPHHFAYIDGIDEPGPKGERSWANNEMIRRTLMPALRKAWADLQLTEGRLRFSHDVYLKLFQLQACQVEADFLLVDEAQDLSPVMMAIAEAQKDTQVVYVGDSQQEIYGWRGAVNALEEVPADDRTFLSQSFRFGPAIADVANLILDILGSELVLKGLDTIASRVESTTMPKAILCRTNAGAVSTLLRELGEGGQPHLVGGGREVSSFARAAKQLQEEGRTGHPELACFDSWKEVQDYVQAGEADDLKLMVRLLDEFGADRIIRALEQMPAEDRASVVISTAHKAKGREWDTVRLHDDYGDEGVESAEDWRLLYVAATRAKKVLDPVGCKPLQHLLDERDEDEPDADLPGDRFANIEFPEEGQGGSEVLA